jgi:hypothetical protein
MASTEDGTGTPERTEFSLRTKHLPAPATGELPEMPASTWRIVGPGIVAAGVGLSSGEFILWPYIASQVGLVFLWGAIIGVITQWFLNMEIERYTLATGETAVTGFNRYWKHWGLVFAGMTYFANLWPGWATSSASMVTYLIGGDSTAIAIVLLLTGAAILTLAPVVYVALERLLLVKVLVIGGFFLLALLLVVEAASWEALPSAVTHIGQFPQQVGFSVLLGAIAFAGAGGGQNLCQSNWIRDKGFGMGRYIPRLVSPVTGKEESAPTTVGHVFPATESNLARWRRWWRFANLEQGVTFAAVTIVTIVIASMLAHSTLFGEPGLANNTNFLKTEGERMQEAAGGWFGALFWVIGAFSLFAASVGIVDYTSRLAADVLKSTYLRGAKISESRLYFWLVWGLAALGCGILLLGVNQPLVLLVISACVGGLMMFVYSIMLLVMNRTALPKPIRVRSYRVAALIWSTGFFGVLSAITVWEQVQKLLS